MKRSRTEPPAHNGVHGVRGIPLPGIDPQTARVLRQFRQIFSAVRAHFQNVERAAGIGGAQVWALGIIRDRPGIGVKELSLAMDVHQSTASNLVKALAEQGLVAVTRGQSDRRTVRLDLLAAGRAILRKSPGPYSGVLLGALLALDGRALSRLEKDLARLIESLGADGRAAGIPLAQILVKAAPAPAAKRSMSQ